MQFGTESLESMDARTLPWERQAMIGSSFPQIKQIIGEIDDAIWRIHD